MQPVIVLLLGAWVSGIVVGVAVPTLLLCGTAAALLVSLVYWHNRSPAVTAGVGLVFLLGIVYGSSSASWRTAVLPQCQPAVSLTGRIIVRPDVREKSVRYLLADDSGCRYLVYADRWPVYERDTIVTVSGGKYADQATILAQQPEFGRYVRQQQAVGVWSYPHVTAVSVATTDTRYRSLVNRVHEVFVEPDASLIGALLLADRGQFPANLNEYFRRTSLTHILSISGTHISLLAGMVFALAALLPWPPLVRTGVVIGFLWLYVWFVGAPVSAVRAGFFWSVTLVALRLGLLVSLPTAVISTLVLMLTWQPLLALDIGLQLSFLAVVGIGLALFIAKPWRRRIPPLARVLASALIVSTGATALTWPLISYYFGLVSLSAAVANLLILPSVPVIMVGSMVAVSVSYVLWFGSYVVAWPVHLATAWMMGVAHVLGTLPGTWLEITVSRQFIAGYYICLLLLTLLTVRRQKRTWREIWE